MNGRLIAHFFAQLFLLLPPIAFDLVNSLMFLAQVWLVYRIANRRGERSVLLFCLAFAGVWLFELAFGQVNLWLTGACNYLWAAVFCLAFLVPYVDKVFENRDLSMPAVAAYYLLSFVAGAYCENASSAAIFVAFFLACYAKFILHYRLRFYHYGALAVAFLGFLWMMSAPYMKNASNDLNLWSLFSAFGRAGNMFYKLWPVVLGFAVLFTLGCFRGVQKQVLVSTAILAAGAVFAEVIMIFAEYNVERRAFFTFVLLLAACAMLFVELMRSDRVLLSCLSVCMLLATVYYVSLGLSDIALTHRDVLRNEAKIISAAENGERELTLPEVQTRTDYNALTGIQYLRDDSSYWLNRCMARHYGLDTIHLQEK